MSVIKGKGARLSLRAKFTSPSEVQIVVVDHETQATYCIEWSFVEDSIHQTDTKVSKSKSGVTDTEEADHDK